MKRLTLASMMAAALTAGNFPREPGGQDDPRPKPGSVGNMAQGFELQGLQDESVEFPDRESGQTKLTVLVFWASWNEPSKVQLARLADTWPRWQPHGVRLIAVNVESTRHTPEELEDIVAWLVETPLPFPVVLDRGLEAFHAYGIVAVPTTVVVDAEGRIVHRMPGYPIAGAEEFVDFVEERVIEQSRASRSSAPNRTPERQRALRHTRLARLLLQRDQVELAEYSLRRAITEDDRLLDARLALATLFERTQRVDKARALLEEAALSFPEEARLDTARADFELRHGSPALAGELSRRAIARNPSLSEPHIVLARVLQSMNDHDGARSQLSAAVAANPLNVPAHVELGRLSETTGDEKGAFQWYVRAFELLRPDWSL